MRKIAGGKGIVEQEVFCNVCAKKLYVKNGILMEDAFEVTKEWGYFSKRDLEIHRFNICEECYEKMVSGFQIPIEVRRKVEAL